MGLFGMGKKQTSGVRVATIQKEVISDLVRQGELSVVKPFEHFSKPDQAKITKEVNLRLQEE